MRTRFAPSPWTPPPPDPDARSVASSPLDRAFDLEKAGLELVLCIDSTGSMQGTIDAAAAACDFLDGLSKKVSSKEEIAQVGKQIEVTVSRLVDYGAFVSVYEGVEGLIHISELSQDRVENVASVVKPGDQVKA